MWLQQHRQNRLHQMAIKRIRYEQDLNLLEMKLNNVVVDLLRKSKGRKELSEH